MHSLRGWRYQAISKDSSLGLHGPFQVIVFLNNIITKQKRSKKDNCILFIKYILEHNFRL